MSHELEESQTEISFETSFETSWIKDFELMDKEYESFYKEDNHYIHLCYVYVNLSDEIEYTKEDKLLLRNSNSISREELLGILKGNSINNGKKYTILSILKYNIGMEPLEVKKFVTSKTPENYLYPVKNIDTIPLEQTISMFQDLNDLIIVFYENDKRDLHNSTKKVYINGHKKTMRKRLKVESKI